MEQLNELRSASETVLNGLKADDALKMKILAAASEEVTSKPSATVKRHSDISGSIRWMKFVPAVCCVTAVLAIGLIVGLNFRDMTQKPVITSFTAGVRKSSPISLRASASGNATSGLNEISISGSGILYPKENGYFPMIRLGGRVYRQLNLTLSDSVKLTDLGTVSLYTDDPALADESIDLSNLLPEGTQVYGIDGCGSAFAIAELSGKKMIFQRSSFLGDAILPGEILADTLPFAGRVVSVSDDKGRSVSDPVLAKELYTLLLEKAEYKGSGDVAGDCFILFHLDNGLACQFRLNGSLFSACGTWSCPEFIDAFEKSFE